MRLTRHAVTLATAALLAPPVQAQVTDTAKVPASRSGRFITALDLKNWNSIRQSALSNDGKWFAYVVGPTDGDVTVVVRGTARDGRETRIFAGNGGGSIAISGDSRWLGLIVAPPKPPTGRAGRGGAVRAAPDSTRGTADVAPTKFVLVNLATGERKEFERIRRFAFNAEDAGWIVMQGGSPAVAGNAGPGGGRGFAGPGSAAEATSGGSTDLLLYNLASGETFNMGRAAEYAFNRDGDWLAYTMSSPDQLGNGVQLRNMKTGASRSLENSRLLYTHLAWVDSSSALSVMRGRLDSLTRDTVFTIEAFTSFGADGPTRRIVFDPGGRDDFPAGMKVASDRAPRYAAGVAAIFFGIRAAPPIPRTAAARGGAPVLAGAPGAGGAGAVAPGGRGAGSPAATSSDSIPSLILWHYKDPRLQSQQIVQEQQDRAFNYLSEYRVGDNRFIRLADDSIRTVTVTNGDSYAFGVNSSPYEERASYTGRNYQDVYAIDLKTGARTLIQKKKPIGAMSGSPDGKRVLFWGKDANWWVLDLATGDSVNITKGMPTSFGNTEDDHNNLYLPADRALGWSTDGAWVLLSDNWDIWKVPTNPGAAAVNLTGDGKRNQVRYQNLYRFDASGVAGATRGGRGGRGVNPADGIDLSQPLYVAMYGEWTKKEGVARIDPGLPGARSLIFEDAKFNVLKARDAETYLYTRQTFTEYPNYWVFNAGFAPGYRITDVNPQIADFAWSAGTRLVNYVSAKGDKLQGAL